MKEQNELLRSAYQIAERKGADTNWEAFENNLGRELLKQAGCPGSSRLLDKQTILRATCTAKTYQVVDHPMRVIAEKEALDGKLSKLKSFFDTDIYRKLDPDEQDRLVKQVKVMAEYSQILRHRIAAF